MGSYYRPPNANVQCLDLISESVWKVNKSMTKFIILEDFNRDFLKQTVTTFITYAESLLAKTVNKHTHQNNRNYFFLFRSDYFSKPPDRKKSGCPTINMQ